LQAGVANQEAVVRLTSVRLKAICENLVLAHLLGGMMLFWIACNCGGGCARIPLLGLLCGGGTTTLTAPTAAAVQQGQPASDELSRRGVNHVVTVQGGQVLGWRALGTERPERGEEQWSLVSTDALATGATIADPCACTSPSCFDEWVVNHVDCDVAVVAQCASGGSMTLFPVCQTMEEVVKPAAPAAH
jgi:hypothetical protein